MTSPVHILVTVRKPELLRAATLVFDSLRVGFPNSKVIVTLNGWKEGSADWEQVLMACNRANVYHTKINVGTMHHEWILDLIENGSEPTFICDTDIVFHENFERFDFTGCALAGRYIPQFFCSFSKAITRPRLHGCLLYLDPVLIKQRAKEYGEQFPEAYCLPRPTLQDLVFPRYVPHRFGALNKPLFYDTCAGLFHAIGGQMFTDEQNLAFDHGQSMTISDLVAPHYPGGDMIEHHFAAFELPSILKGQWQRDKAFYAARAC